MRSPDVVCLSHVPWRRGLERPHQLMQRCARERRVFFVEPPTVAEGAPHASVTVAERNVHVLSQSLPLGLGDGDALVEQRRFLASIARALRVTAPVVWVYAPARLPTTRGLAPSLLVYDCVDDLEARPLAPAEARVREAELFARADLVFTAGYALFEAKRHHNVSTYPLPSSVDHAYFAHARGDLAEPRDQKRIARPRVGYVGAIDEHVDLELVGELARWNPDLHLVLVGPLVGIGTELLPKLRNVHWLGEKSYAELPAYIAGWDAAIVPWKWGETTRRLESLGALACIAAGKPLVATPLDELLPCAEHGLARLEAPEGFGAAVEAARADAADRISAATRDATADALLGRSSWDRTWKVMNQLVGEASMARALSSGRLGHALL